MRLKIKLQKRMERVQLLSGHCLLYRKEENAQIDNKVQRKGNMLGMKKATLFSVQIPEIE